MPVSAHLPDVSRSAVRPGFGLPELAFLLPLIVVVTLGTIELQRARSVESEINLCLHDQLPSGQALSDGWQSRLSERLSQTLNITPEQVRIQVEPDPTGEARIQVSVPYAPKASVLGGWLGDASLEQTLIRPVSAS